MVIERPESIFGKVPYGTEQKVLIDVTGDITKGVALIEPSLVGIPEFFTKFRSERDRLDRMNAFFNRAKERLESIGV